MILCGWKKVAILLLWMLLIAATDEAPSVAIIELRFKGQINEGMRSALAEGTKKGLTDAGMKVQLYSAKQIKSCSTPACWRQIAGKLGCRYLIDGLVTGEDRSYQIKLRIIDGYNGKTKAQVDRRCDICGLRAVAEKIELAASALRAKVVELAQRSATTVTIQTDPAGATILVNNDVVGVSPNEIQLSAGKHEIVAQLKGHITSTRSIVTVEGVSDKVSIKLIPTPNRAKLRIAGWTTLGAGIASIVAGVLFFSLDGDAYECTNTSNFQCPKLWETSAAAWSTMLIGASGALAGAYLLYRGYSR
jgi:hypothetical protein